MIIDATNLILGRLASFAAKNALLGERIDIINCEKAVITGNKRRTLADYKEKIHIGSITKGPFTPRKADMFVKRVIRGMLPYKKENGKKAFKRIKCYAGVPDEFRDKQTEQLNLKGISKLNVVKYTTVKEVCKT